MTRMDMAHSDCEAQLWLVHDIIEDHDAAVADETGGEGIIIKLPSLPSVRAGASGD